MKLNMKLTPWDIERITILKKRYGLRNDAEVIRYALLRAATNDECNDKK